MADKKMAQKDKKELISYFEIEKTKKKFKYLVIKLKEKEERRKAQAFKKITLFVKRRNIMKAKKSIQITGTLREHLNFNYFV